MVAADSISELQNKSQKTSGQQQKMKRSLGISEQQTRKLCDEFKSPRDPGKQF